MPEISVIIPVYNMEKYLNRCVDSVLSQTFTDIEIILVDDGSTDNSPEICDNYKEIDDRIIVIHKPNGGLSDARNAGLDVATGNYIGFVDSDDYIDHRMYEILYDLIVTNNADIAHCLMKKITDNDFIINHITYNQSEVNTYQHKDFIENYFPNFPHIIPSPVCSKLFRKKIFNEIRFPVGQYYEDSYIQLRTLDLCQSIVVINLELYYYVQREGSIMHSEYSPKWFQGTNNNNNNIDFFRKKHLKKQVEYAQEDYLTRFCKDKFAVLFYKPEYLDNFKQINRKFLREVPSALMNHQICRMKKLAMLLLFISPKTALRLCRKYFPECLYDFMR